MRIFSELSTDEALEVVLQIAQPITNLIDDEALVKEMQKAMPEGRNDPHCNAAFRPCENC